MITLFCPQCGKEIDAVLRSEFLAVLRMLIARATWRDKWRARRKPGHWLNVARREVHIRTPFSESLLRCMMEGQ